MNDPIDRRSFAALGLAGGAALFATAAKADQGPAGEAGRAHMLGEIAEARRAFADILYRGDHRALPGLFTADTLVMPAGKPLVRGRDAVVAFWTAASSDPGRRLRSQFENVDSMFEGGIVIEAGKAIVTAVEGDHEEVVDHGKYIVVWKHDEGRWKRHRDIFNSDGARV